MRQARFSRLGRRLVLLVFSYLVVFGLVAGFFVFRNSINDEIARSNEGIRQLVRAVQKQADIAVFVRDAGIAHDLLIGLLTNDDLVAARIVGLDGFEQTQTRIAGGASPTEINLQTFTLHSPLDESSIIGRLVLSIDVDIVRKRAKSQATENVVILFAEIVFTALLLVIIFRFVVERPLYDLARVLSTIVPGDTQRVAIDPQHSQNEIGTVAITVNHLLDAVEHALDVERDLRRRQELDHHQLELTLHDLKNTEVAMRLARDLAETANRTKSEFLASMSHELRTPLNAVIGFSQMLQIEEGLSEDAQDSVNEIETAGRHLLLLVNDILDLASIEAGKIELTLETIDFSSVLTESLAMVNPLALARGLHLYNKIGAGDTAFVEADAVRLRQAVINLLSNAIKYNRTDGTVTVTMERDDTSVRILVTDTGLGIPADKQNRVFTAFDRLGKEAIHSEGTGIGLLITRQLVNAMGGAVGFESVEGCGSTFWIELQCAANDGAKAASGTTISTGDAECEQGLNQDASIVLYVEDNAANAKLLQRVFARQTRLILQHAPTAEIGIEIARSAPPVLILMDINLPGMSGVEALHQLRSDDRTCSIPVVAVTANAMKGDQEQGERAGFDAYITKPIDVNGILATLDAVLIKRVPPPPVLTL